MQIKPGKGRIVLLLPSLGVAIKFPRVRLIALAHSLKYIFIDSKPELIPRRLTRLVEDSYDNKGRWGFFSFLFGGWADNQVEYKFWKVSRNEFAWPTVFSLWGLANIQKLGKQPDRDWDAIWSIMVDVMDRDIQLDLHCFYNPENFCTDRSGRLYLLDYASEASQTLLRKHGRALREKL